MGVSKMLEKQIAALKALDGATVEAGWFESNRYPDGKSVAEVARINEFGALIKVDAHEQTIYRRIDESTGTFKNGGKFVPKEKANYATTHSVAAYQIVIPPRPFMRLAWYRFQIGFPALQKKLGKDFLSGKLSADGMLNQIGLHLEGLIVASINNGGWKPNAKSTIAKKGFDNPLTHFGTMKQTVTYKISR